MTVKNKIKVECLGHSAFDVTQSIYQITVNTRHIILDYGLYQSSNLEDCYKINHTVIKQIDPKKIDFIIISHANIDHCGALPYLYHRGCTAPIYVAKGNKALIKLMLYDSQKIMESDAIKLENSGINAHALYSEADIERCLTFMLERDLGSEFNLCDGITCKLTSAHHIIGSAQVDLTFNFDGLIKRVHYTGDIGSPYIDKCYVEPFVFPDKCDVMIGECTYSGEQRNHNVRDRAKDIEKIESIIQEKCLEHRQKVLFPVFAMDRLQNILTVLYDIYSERSLNVPILIDTPLGTNICNIWSSIATCDVDKWEKIMNWKAITFVEDYATSKAWQEGSQPVIVLASSGMCTNGRSVGWVKNLISHSENHIIFCGYSADGTIAQKIKDEKQNRVIKIEGKIYPNKCGITTLNSFSSHACRSELLDLYTECVYNKLVLVHSDFDSKCIFAEELKEMLAKANRTSKVIIANEGLSFFF